MIWKNNYNQRSEQLCWDALSFISLKVYIASLDFISVLVFAVFIQILYIMP